MWGWNGAKWWRVDFHTHSPASDDYGRGPDQTTLKARTPRDWLLDYMLAEIDCVVIADHNTGNWVDLLTRELATMAEERPNGFRELCLFPGVEISVNGGIHLLAVLALGRTAGDVDRLLGAVGYGGTRGMCDGVTTRSLSEVIGEIHGHGALAVPAHVDGPDGLFTTVTGKSLAQALACREVLAMEVATHPVQPPAQYADSGAAWTEVVGSDSHHPSGTRGQRYPGSHFSWVKMGQPTLEGLRLALMDGPMSVRRSETQAANPNLHANLVVESVEVDAARYMGRATTFMLRLNPWLNAIVGGRGTGKSTVIELLRLALRRTDEMPAELAGEFDKYRTAYPRREDPGLLTADTIVRVVYRKDGTRYRIKWTPDQGGTSTIEEADEDGWREVEGDVAQRFPVRIYSQRQIFHLAGMPRSLLGIIDESPDVDRHSWDRRWLERRARFLTLRAQARELDAGLADEPRLRGELDDIRQRLSVFEQSNHAEVLKTYEASRHQEQLIEGWETRWLSTGDRLRQTADALVPVALTLEDDDGTGVNTEILESARVAMTDLTAIQDSTRALAEQADAAVTRWRTARDGSASGVAIAQAKASYEALVLTLAAEGAGDVAEYGALVLRRQRIEESLTDLAAQRARATDLQREARVELEGMLADRRQLTDRRIAFLDGVLRDNRYIRIRVVSYGSVETVESEYRDLIQRPDTGFERDIGAPGTEGILGGLYDDVDAPSVERALADLKARTRTIARGGPLATELRDPRFAAHLRRLPPEGLDRVDSWFPEDSLEVQYSSTTDGQHFRAIEEASPGQKTAALLAFLLSYGNEPLVLDQPEDDLDNRLIYDLIVTQLRQAKSVRQILLVTHNANVVVNGDAELVVALAARGGESQIDSQGSLQEPAVRNTICDVLEGGRAAFEQRYRRISIAMTT